MSRDSHLRRFSRLKRTSSLSRADPESRNYWDSFFFFFPIVQQPHLASKELKSLDWLERRCFPSVVRVTPGGDMLQGSDP